MLAHRIIASVGGERVDPTNGYFSVPHFRRILNIDIVRGIDDCLSSSRIPWDFVPLFSTSRRRVWSHFVIPKRVEASGTHCRRTPVQRRYSGHASRPLVLGHYLLRSFRCVSPHANFSLGTYIYRSRVIWNCESIFVYSILMETHMSVSMYTQSSIARKLAVESGFTRLSVANNEHLVTRR